MNANNDPVQQTEKDFWGTWFLAQVYNTDDVISCVRVNRQRTPEEILLRNLEIKNGSLKTRGEFVHEYKGTFEGFEPVNDDEGINSILHISCDKPIYAAGTSGIADFVLETKTISPRELHTKFYNRAFILDKMSPFFAHITGQFSVSAEDVISLEKSGSLPQNSNWVSNLVNLNESIFQIRREKAAYLAKNLPLQSAQQRRTLSNTRGIPKRYIRCVETEYYSKLNLLNFASEADWYKSSPMEFMKVFSFQMYAIIRTMISVGFLHNDLNCSTLRFTRLQDRELGILRKPYMFHFDEITYRLPERFEGFVPLVIPSQKNILTSMGSTFKSITPTIDELYEKLGTSAGIDPTRGVFLSPEHMFLTGKMIPPYSPESDLFCIGLCIVCAAFADEPQHNPILVSMRSDAYRRFSQDFLREAVRSGSSRGNALIDLVYERQVYAAVLVDLLGFPTDAQIPDVESTLLWKMLSRDYRTGVRGKLWRSTRLQERMGTSGMNMLRSMLSFDREERMDTYLTKAQSYFSEFSQSDSEDLSMSAIKILPGTHSHWGPQLHVRGCIGNFNENTSLVFRETAPVQTPSNVGIKRKPLSDGARSTPPLSQPEDFRKEQRILPTINKRKRIEQQIVPDKMNVCCSCGFSPSKMAIGSGKNRVSVCSQTCANALPSDNRFMSYITSLNPEILNHTRTPVGIHYNNIAKGALMQHF